MDALMAEVIEGHIRFHILPANGRATEEQALKSKHALLTILSQPCAHTSSRRGVAWDRSLRCFSPAIGITSSFWLLVGHAEGFTSGKGTTNNLKVAQRLSRRVLCRKGFLSAHIQARATMFWRVALLSPGRYTPSVLDED
jgi:hypothetical protein